MTSELHAQQEWEWATLYDRIKSVLQQYGEADDGTEEKDYLLMDDNLGWYKHTIETNKLELMQPVVVKSLRKLLIDIRTGRSSLHSDDLQGPPNRVGNDDGLDEGDPPGRDRHGVRRLEQRRRHRRRLHWARAAGGAATAVERGHSLGENHRRKFLGVRGAADGGRVCFRNEAK